MDLAKIYAMVKHNDEYGKHLLKVNSALIDLNKMIEVLRMAIELDFRCNDPNFKNTKEAYDQYKNVFNQCLDMTHLYTIQQIKTDQK